MLHTVEIRFAGEHFKDVILQVRGWLDEKKLQPTAFDIGFTSPSRSCGSILKLNSTRKRLRRRLAVSF